MSATFTGVGGALPRESIPNGFFQQVSDSWIRQRTGVIERRWCSGDETLLDLAEAASLEAIADADSDPFYIDGVIVATTTHKPNSPALAPLLAARVGASEVPALDVNGACSGFLYAVACAAGFISQGISKNVLVCAAEKMSTVIENSEVGSAVLFGDGAGAVVLSQTPCSTGRACFPKFRLSSDGNAGELLRFDPDGGQFVMDDGVTVYTRAVNEMVNCLECLIADHNVKKSEIDLVFPHQASSRIVSTVQAKLGIDADRVVNNMELIGNTSAASIPIAMWEARSSAKLQPGNRLALAAFGAGLTWGAGLIGWQACLCDEA